MTINTFREALGDDKRLTCNSLLRVKASKLQRSKKKEIAVRVAGVVMTPLKILEGAGLIVAGAVLAPIPCTILKVETHHFDDNVKVENVRIGFRKPNLPIYYRDVKYKKGSCITSRGLRISLMCGENYARKNPDEVYTVSSVTGYNLLTTGVGKVVTSAFSVLLLPVRCTSIALSKRKDPI